MRNTFVQDQRFERYIDEHTANPRLWRHALRESLTRLNSHAPIDILDAGGGTGALERTVAEHACYWLLDKSEECVSAQAGARRVLGDSEALPFADASFDLVISISTLQYIDHAKFFSECERVLRPGGILAIHENGRDNPVIGLGRIFRRRSARQSPDIQRYLATITGYYNPDSAQANELECIYRKAYFLLSPISFVLELRGHGRLGRLAERITKPLDDRLLRYSHARRWAWFNVQHFRKLPRQPR